MTPAERVRAEKERILAEAGQYIPPYRLASLMEAASKIAKYMSAANVCVSYQECRLVLDIVDRAIKLATGEEREDGDPG